MAHAPTIGKCPHDRAYRDTFRLLLAFVQQEAGMAPCALDFADLNALVHSSIILSANVTTARERATPDSRPSTRLLGFAALYHPEHAALIARVLAIPTKRTRRNNISYRHSAIALMSSADVHYGYSGEIIRRRKMVLDLAYLSYPERFVNKAPTPPSLSGVVWINQPAEELTPIQ